MNSLTRLERDLFPDLFRRWARPLSLDVEQPAMIKVDITENEKDYAVRAEIPGAKKEDIRVSVDGNYVSISAEVKKEEEKKTGKDGRVLVKESYYGATSRSFTLDHEIDDKAVVAKLEDGVLKLTLPKREGARSKLIKID
jgi:HSP20 family protein